MTVEAKLRLPPQADGMPAGWECVKRSLTGEPDTYHKRGYCRVVVGIDGYWTIWKPRGNYMVTGHTNHVRRFKSAAAAAVAVERDMLYDGD